MMSPPNPLARRLVWVAFVALIVLHHDWWYWNDATLLAGFLPIGLAYHMGFSVAAALLWASASRWAWPLDEHGQDPDPISPPSPHVAAKERQSV
jgi:hypothetical protein